MLVKKDLTFLCHQRRFLFYLKVSMIRHSCMNIFPMLVFTVTLYKGLIKATEMLVAISAQKSCQNKWL